MFYLYNTKSLPNLYIIDKLFAQMSLYHKNYTICVISCQCISKKIKIKSYFLKKNIKIFYSLIFTKRLIYCELQTSLFMYFKYCVYINYTISIYYCQLYYIEIII